MEACERADTSSTVFEVLEEMVRRYLYDPNSPVRNEDLFGAFAEALSHSEAVRPETRGIYAFEAARCALNAVGTRAADFPFTDLRGRVRTLYGIKAEWTLLVFGNPGCNACRELVAAMQQMPGVGVLVDSGRLAVLDVYIDEEVDKWKAEAETYPKTWINGYDHRHQIRTDVTYHIRAIPSMYVLDRDKTVILKDAPQEVLLDFLSSISEPLNN